MIVSIRFRVKNRVKIGPHFPIETNGSTLFIETEENVVKSVAITRRGVDVQHAPTFSPSDSGTQLPTLSVQSGFFEVLAERELREWQAVLAPYVIFDIDFDDAESNFTPESEAERAVIKVHSVHHAVGTKDRNPIEFEHIGRAFLMKEEASTRLEDIAHFRDASIAQYAGRNVDAYNGHFLFLETRYCGGKTQKKEQVKRLLAEPIFVEKLKSAVESFRSEFGKKKSRLPVAQCDTKDVSGLIEEIISLRGELRHHSLNSPRRWDPNNVKRYELEARFLGAVCGYILLDELFMRTYQPEVVQSFVEQAHKSGFKLALLIDRRSYEGHVFDPVRATYPLREADIRTASSAFSNVLRATTASGELGKLRELICRSEKRKIDIFTASLGTAFEAGTKIDVGSAASVRIEYVRDGVVFSGAFQLAAGLPTISRAEAWELGNRCMEHFFHRTPDHELLSLRALSENTHQEIFSFRVGPGLMKGA